MTFEEKLQMYAELIVVHGLNIQHGQVLNISTEAYHRDLAAMITEVAYQRGAKAVIVDLSDPRFGRLRLQNSADDDLQYVPEYIGLKYRELVDGASANLSLIGPEEPDILTDQDPARINTVRIARHMAVKHFYDEGIGKSKVHWTVAAAATPKWGQKIFPTLQPKDAEAALWEQIFTICRADQPNCLELWREHNRVLQARAKRLTKLAIEELHFVGPGTDLRVRLSDKAIFKLSLIHI